MRTSFRTIALWVILIVFFIAFYKFFSAPVGDAAARESAPGAGEIFLKWLPVLLVFFGLFVVKAFLTRRDLKQNNAGIALLNRGRVLEALQQFELAKARMKKTGLVHYNVGVANLWLWRVKEAEAAFTDARRLELPAPYDAYVAGRLSVVAALRGDTANARRWIEETRTHKDEDALRMLAETILLCRAGDFAGALAVVDRPELRTLVAMERGLADALRAWCVERTTGQVRIVDTIALYGETGPDKVRLVWPELADYAEGSLSPAARAAARRA